MKEVFSTEDILTSKSFYNTDYMKPEMITQTMTWLVGNKFKETPLSMMTVGASATGRSLSMDMKDSGTVNYEYPIMGEIDKYPAISSSIYQAGDKPGLGGNPFKVRFGIDWFKKGYVIESSGEIQVRIDDDPIAVGTEYEYTVRLVSGTHSSFCPLEELDEGVQWAQMWSPNSFNGSDAPGSGQRVLPGKATNQLSLVRASRQWAGNTANKAIEIQVPGVGGEMSNFLIDYDAWNFERQWAFAKECALWYSKYNKLPDGTVYLREVHGQNEDIPMFAGLLEQIPNVFTYNKLTYNKLKSIIHDVYADNQDTDAQKVTLMTGLGGLEEIDNALKGYLNTDIISGAVHNDKFVKGEGDNMELQGFFTKVRFIGGFEVTIIRNPVFDYGKRAKKSRRHPRTGRPIESYRMVFLDTNNYDGEANLVYLYERGRQRIDKHIAGMSQFPKGLPNAPEFVSSAKDRSSTHRMETCSITMRRPSKSIHGICVAS
jgi:hypothetical protein